MGPVFGLGDLLGERIGADELAARFARRGWRPMFFALARVAAILCNDARGRGGRLRALQDALCTHCKLSTSRRERLLAQQLELRRDTPVAHESAIYFLQALALMHGSEDDSLATNDAELAFLLLAANDYVFDWRNADERQLTLRETLLASTCRSLIFNQGGDSAAGVVRGAVVLQLLPRRTKRWRTPEEWEQLQVDAFGVPIADYVEAFAGPIYVSSNIWETTREARGERRPAIDPNEWTKIAGFRPDVTQEYFGKISVNRETARTLLTNDARGDGLPVAPTLFHRHPFVRFSDSCLVAASPWVVREHLRVGLWARMRDAARDERGRGSPDWTSAFGDLAEQWCQRVAKYASEAPRFIGSVIVPPSPDDGEIEDVLVIQKNRVALISSKGTVFREDVLRGAKSQSNAVDYFERFFFGPKQGDQRGGAARLLDAKLRKLRDGSYEPLVSRHAVVYPIVVTYDDLGTDNPAVYDYFKERCHATQLLQDRRVRPLVCVGIETFENLMGYCAEGANLFDLLDRKSRPPYDIARLDVLIEKRSGSVRHRLPQIEHEFIELSGRIQARLAAAHAASTAGAAQHEQWVPSGDDAEPRTSNDVEQPE